MANNLINDILLYGTSLTPNFWLKLTLSDGINEYSASETGSHNGPIIAETLNLSVKRQNQKTDALLGTLYHSRVLAIVLFSDGTARLVGLKTGLRLISSQAGSNLKPAFNGYQITLQTETGLALPPFVNPEFINPSLESNSRMFGNMQWMVNKVLLDALRDFRLTEFQ